jgi:hypothetical protein
MNYRSIWLTQAELGQIERSERMAPGTLKADQRADGTRLTGAYANNVIHRVTDPCERDRAEFAIRLFCELESCRR